MDAKTAFTKKFQELMASGGHIVASILDSEGKLQISEIYGADLRDGTDLIISMFFSINNSPDFYRALAPQKKVAMVICSPFSMETYQVKGLIEEIGPITEESEAISNYWRENYLSCLQNIGVPQSAIDNVNYKSSHHFSMKIDQMFLQTPHRGTGGTL